MHTSNEGDNSLVPLTVSVSGPCQTESDAIISFFERIAEEEQWRPEGQIQAYRGRSTYFGLWSWQPGAAFSVEAYGTDVVAALQLVRPDDMGMIPSHGVWPELTVGEPAQTAHIAILAVDPKWRGKHGGTFWLLTAQMWNYCVKAGIRDLWLEATPRTMRCYQRLGWPLQVRGELRSHWGENCYICYLSVRDVAGELAQRAVRSGAYRRVLADMVGIVAQGP